MNYQTIGKHVRKLVIQAIVAKRLPSNYFIPAQILIFGVHPKKEMVEDGSAEAVSDCFCRAASWCS